MPGINRCSAGVVKPMRKKAVAHRPRIADVQRELARPIRAGRTARMVRLLIADSQELIRLGLRAMLAGEPGLSIRGEAGTLAEAVAEARRVRPDLVLLDAHLPDGSGIEACRLLCNAHARIRILIMTEDKSTAASRKALKAGAYGVIYKDSCHAELLRTVRLAVSNEGHLKSASVNRASRGLKPGRHPGPPFKGLAALATGTAHSPIHRGGENQQGNCPRTGFGKSDRQELHREYVSEAQYCSPDAGGGDVSGSAIKSGLVATDLPQP